jgi:hypothetical protein
MKRIASMLIGALLIGAGIGIAMAQEGAPPPPANPPAVAPTAPLVPPAVSPAAPVEVPPPAATEHADEVAAFHRMIRAHHRMWKRLKQNPTLASDDAFVGKYPDLRDFFNKYQGSKERFLADPGLYLKMSEAKAMHREQTRGPGVE